MPTPNTPKPPVPSSDLAVHQRGKVMIVELLDRRLIDPVQIERIGQQLKELVKNCPIRPLVLMDFHQVEFLSSAAMGVLISLDQRVREKDGQLRLANIHEEIHRLFKLVKLSKHIPMHETTQEALEAFR
jgi:anti-sigma B factor antagonist